MADCLSGDGLVSFDAAVRGIPMTKAYLRKLVTDNVIPFVKTKGRGGRLFHPPAVERAVRNHSLRLAGASEEEAREILGDDFMVGLFGEIVPTAAEPADTQ